MEREKFLYLPFTSKNNRRKENSTIKFCFKFFISPPKWENWFLTRLKGKKLVEFLFILFFRFTAHRGLGYLIHYSITVGSAAPQITLWRGPEPTFEP